MPKVSPAINRQKAAAARSRPYASRSSAACSMSPPATPTTLVPAVLHSWPHVGALTPLAVNVHQGAASVVMRAFDPVRAWSLIEQERITGGLMVPAMELHGRSTRH